MTGLSVPESPASDLKMLENDRHGHLHIRGDDGTAQHGKANRCIPERDGGAGGGCYWEEIAEKEEEKAKWSRKISSNIKSDALSSVSGNSNTAIHVSLIVHFIASSQ